MIPLHPNLVLDHEYHVVKINDRTLIHDWLVETFGLPGSGIRTAQMLKRDGWVHDMYDLSALECHKRAEWCMETFGPMYNDTIMAGKWYGAELPFQTGGVTPKRQFVFMFRDDKLYTMYKMMFSENESTM